MLDSRLERFQERCAERLWDRALVELLRTMARDWATWGTRATAYFIYESTCMFRS